MSAEQQGEESSRARDRRLVFAAITAAAFVLYWSSSFVLDARGAVTHFGADQHHFEMLAEGTVFDRAARFHPLTIGMALAWMKILDPLTAWITPYQLLKAMFAAAGAAGVWAAMSAFATAAPGASAPLFGVTYATSFSIWYFASIEESKIVTATLCALYIASYLRLRERWTPGGALLLSAILLAACLNEIVSCFLVVIPLVDTFKQRGRDWPRYSWIAAHAVAALLAFAILEGVVDGMLPRGEADTDEASHIRLLLSTIAENEYGLSNLYAFALNWFLFSLAAPTVDASYDAPTWGEFKGYFEPALLGYLASPISAALMAVAAVIGIASALPRYRGRLTPETQAVLLALMAYVLLRGVFFFIFNSDESLLFTPAIVPAYLLVIATPVALATFPGKPVAVAAFAGLLFATNAAFIIGP